MKRRDFLAMSLALAGASVSRPALAQPAGPLMRAAIVIGVDRPQRLPPLSAAAAGARKVADWLRADGFDVSLLVDGSDKPVQLNQIYRAVEAQVDKGTLDQLVVYFSGHGFLLSPGAEYWMLSGAPINANEAVNLYASINLARDCGIPHVVFISDACRSLASTLQFSSMTGGVIFPTPSAVRDPRAEVDRFYATLPGDPSLEVKEINSAQQYEGIYTACLLDAFDSPEPGMVERVGGVRVVPNRRLKPHLARSVRKRAEERALPHRQNPDAQLESGDSAYIARVAERVGLVSPVVEPKATLVDVANLDIARIGALPARPESTALPQSTVARLAADTGYVAARAAVREAQEPRFETASAFPTGTGILVSGANVQDVAVPPGVEARIASPGQRPGGLREPAVVQVRLSGRAASSVALRFAEGTGGVFAALQGFVATVAVSEGRINNVTYARPGELTGAMRERVNELHAAVATAARFGVFRIAGAADGRNRGAEQLANNIRVLKGVDPTLGLYAAYAYADAGLIRQVRSVRDIMRGDLGVDLFDIAMLADGPARRSGDSRPPTPFCPMLSQGWALLRPSDHTSAAEVLGAREHLRAALWTTLEAKGMDLLAQALLSGRVL